MDQVKLQVFGKLEELMGVKELLWSLPTDVWALRKELQEKYPSLEKIQYAVSVNNKIVSGDGIICKDDAIALLPPFSGG
ncbi:MAG: MoaD/ThiS family protein [Bacteroidia bacterium]|jgi:molybdopterin converting factor small subunit|nr:MoaD/ThiS family protein [Bacteroidota bacterium]MBP6512153.1 MoaD/ThiS family protein [Bacteroidia bacterium]MBP7245044.1 MoaD/ThiS family protein [Bacteroidia bacterium]